MSTPDLWSCGVLGKAHGLRGELYLNLSLGGLEYLRLGTRFYVAEKGLPEEGVERLVPCEVTRAGGTDQRPLVRLDLAPTREAALAVQGAELFAAGEALDELPHYRIGDLVGLRVETAAGDEVGVVADVIQSPAHEILDITTPDGGSRLVPLVDELVSVDHDAGVVCIVDGLIDWPGAGRG
jgi:16S rRNA processing protein RimM